MSRSDKSQTTFVCDRPGCGESVEFDHLRTDKPIGWTYVDHFDNNNIGNNQKKGVLCFNCTKSFGDWYFYIRNTRTAQFAREEEIT